MSFTDPLVFATVPLPRTSVDGDKVEYTRGDGLVVVTADHNVGKRTRRVLRIDSSKISPDAFKPSENVKVTMSNYIVFDTPPAGYTPSEIFDIYAAFQAMYSADGHLLIHKLLGGES